MPMAINSPCTCSLGRPSSQQLEINALHVAGRVNHGARISPVQRAVEAHENSIVCHRSFVNDVAPMRPSMTAVNRNRASCRLCTIGLLCGLMLLSGHTPGQEEHRAGQPAQGAPDVVDHCNRVDPAFALISDPVADDVMAGMLERLPGRLQDPVWAQHCRLPSFGVQVVRGRGARNYDKYDHHYLAAAWFWVREIDGQNHPEEIGPLAHVMKVMSYYESQIGYRSGFTNRERNGVLRFPLQHAGFVDTEDVMQVGNPADLPIHEKVREMLALHYRHSQLLTNLVPKEYTHRNISGPQSIFYGTGWFAYKYCSAGRKAREAIRRYNGNKTVDAWNGQAHRDNYAESVITLFSTGVARSPASGQSLQLVRD
jgi:hypothetical protein